MCTGFVKKGDDLVVGFNLDLAEGVWDYAVYARPDMFYIGIKVGSTVYKVHGVNKCGSFGNLPYMNAPDRGVYRRGKNVQRLDLMVDRFIAGKYSYDDVRQLAETEDIVNVPGCSMHTLFCSPDGNILLVEPGLGFREIRDSFAVITNFPLLEEPADLSPVWYGKDRYDRCVSVLRESGGVFSVRDGLQLLCRTRQEGEWATRVSFVYSRNEAAVHYVRNNDFSNVITHSFR